MTHLDSAGDRETLAAMRVLDALDRREDRPHTQFNRLRRHARRRLRSKIALFIPTGAMGAGEHAYLLQAWCRNRSQDGLSFIHRCEIGQKHVVIELGEHLILSEIVRKREVLDGFHEYGVVFHERITKDSQEATAN